jgi:DNA-binding PadR family transcriptional regulator
MSIYKGHLRIIVLKILAENEMGGYELCKKIEEETGWKPSFGSIYPLLGNLREENLVNIKQEGKKKIYSLKKEGKEKLNELLKRKDELFDRIIESVKLFDVLCGTDEHKDLLPLIEQMKKQPFIQVMPEMKELKKIIFKIMMQKDKEKKAKLKKILKQTNKEVKNLL